MRSLTWTVAGLLVLAPLAAAEETKPATDTKVPAVLNYKMKDLDGKEVNLADYQGKVILFVNVASKCGLTPQYKALQKLHEDYSKEGLVIIGVPANQFLSQEPGSNAEIKKFCTTKYGVKFPVLAKVVVKGKGICPLYKYLTDKETNPKLAGEIKWNFTKFLVARDGTVVKRFEPRVKPESKEVVEAIETELKKK
jgi:glutathione peroxidase